MSIPEKLIPGLSERLEKGWFVVTRDALNNGAYTKGMKFNNNEDIVYKEYPVLQTIDVDHADKQRIIIMKNWNLCERIIFDYNHLLDFQSETEPTFLSETENKNLLYILKLYYKFLNENIGGNIYMKRGKVSHTKANMVYDKAHKDFKDAYDKYKTKRNTSRFKSF